MRRLGSSPRARGAQSRRSARSSSSRIIPACAGSTRAGRPRRSATGDHPRVRGEHSPNRDAARISRGSSPRARGARGRTHVPAVRFGIIPACAGSTLAKRCRVRRRGDHPRVRGEHLINRLDTLTSEGSSPRARGARVARPPADQHRGIIPACAGSTVSHASQRHRPRDHPRVRGEHGTCIPDEPSGEGSSPRARGAPGMLRGVLGLGGIIPACAGSTVSHASQRHRPRDHPRVRGEHGTCIPDEPSGEGSSPRARGAPGMLRGVLGLGGIIPACAGSTVSHASQRHRPRDHPRVRGEHCSSVYEPLLV